MIILSLVFQQNWHRNLRNARISNYDFSDNKPIPHMIACVKRLQYLIDRQPASALLISTGIPDYLFMAREILTANLEWTCQNKLRMELTEGYLLIDIPIDGFVEENLRRALLNVILNLPLNGNSVFAFNEEQFS